MASLIGKFGALLTLDSSRFVRGMEKSGRATKTFGDQAAAMGARLAGVGLGIAAFGAATATAAAGGLAVLARRGLESVDSLTKMADRLGITTEALSALQFAGEQTGVQANQLNLGLQRMTRRIAEAAQGGGEAKDAIAELGLSAASLARMSPDQQFASIADRMAQVQNQSDRVRLSFKLFDSEGVALVNTLRLGSSGLNDMAEQADRLGLTFDRQAAAKVEMANDAIHRMTSLSKGLGQILAVELSPFIKAAADRLTEFATAGGGLRGKVVSSIELVVLSLAKLADFIDLVSAGWHFLRSVVGTVAADVAKNVHEMIVAVETLLEFVGVEVTHSLSRTAFEFAKSVEEETQRAASASAAAWERFSTGAASAQARVFFQNLRADADAAAKAIAEAAPGGKPGGPVSDFGKAKKEKEAEEKRKAALKKAAEQVIESTRTPLEKLRKEREKLQELLNADLIDLNTAERALIASAKGGGLLKKKEGSFEQVVRGRFALGGKSGKNADSEAPKHTELLAQVRDILQRGIPSVAA